MVWATWAEMPGCWPPSQHGLIPPLNVLRLGCIIEICTKCTANKRRTRFSLKALHIPYRFSLIRRGKRENHRFLTPILACQIAAPPSQHATSDFWKSSNFLAVAPTTCLPIVVYESANVFAKHSIFIRHIFQCIGCSRRPFH